MAQLQGKLLKDLIRGIRIFQYGLQIAADRAPVALDQLLPGRAGYLRRSLMSPAHQRPQSRNLIQVQVHGVVPPIRGKKMSWRQANGEASNDSPLVLFAQFRAKWQVRFFPIGRLPPVTPLRKVKARLGFDEEMGFLDLPKKISPHLSHSAIRRQFEDGSVEWPFCLCCAAAALVIGGCCGGLRVAEPMASFVPWYRKGQAMNAAGKQVAIFVRAGARNWFAVAGLGLFLAR